MYCMCIYIHVHATFTLAGSKFAKWCHLANNHAIMCLEILHRGPVARPNMCTMSMYLIGKTRRHKTMHNPSVLSWKSLSGVVNHNHLGVRNASISSGIWSALNRNKCSAPNPFVAAVPQFTRSNRKSVMIDLGNSLKHAFFHWKTQVTRITTTTCSSSPAKSVVYRLRLFAHISSRLRLRLVCRRWRSIDASIEILDAETATKNTPEGIDWYFETIWK